MGLKARKQHKEQHKKQPQSTQKLQFDEIDTPIGVVIVAAKSGLLYALDFADCFGRLNRLLVARFGPVTLDRAADPGGFSSRVRSYFGGEIDALQDVPVEMAGTPFQRIVWAALRQVQPGSTASYGELAASIGRTGAARAVGSANATNPIALAVPCHRIVGSDGSLTGYAGGIDRKRWLLEHESAPSLHARARSVRKTKGEGIVQAAFEATRLETERPGIVAERAPSADDPLWEPGRREAQIFRKPQVGGGTGPVSKPL